MPRLESTLDLLRRHHSSGRPTVSRGTPSSAEWHSLWPSLEAIRGDAAAGDAGSREWLATHHALIAAVEAVRRHQLADAITYRGSGR